MEENKNKYSKSELEELCLKQSIILERTDPLTGQRIFVPNIEKVNKMIREFDFLVDGASRGRAVNEISKIERFLFDHEDDPDQKNQFLATYYSQASVYIENHRNLLEDKRSENWKYLFVSYFKMEDIYKYFNKEISASDFFEDYPIFKEMTQLTYFVKLMEYLRSQVQLQIPVDDEQDIPAKIEELNLKLVILNELGILDALKEKTAANALPNLAKFLTVILDEDPSNWRSVLVKLQNLKLENDKDILSELNLNKAHEIISVFGINMEKD